MSAPLFWPGHGAIMGAICAELVESDGNPEDEAYNRGISDACDAACRQMNELLAAAPETATPSLPLQEPVAWARRWYIDGETPSKEKNEQGRMVWKRKFKFLAVTESRAFVDDVPLVAQVAEHLAAPSLPAVLTDATCRDALAQAKPFVTVACFHPSMDTASRAQRVLEQVNAALATSATPVLP